MLRLLPTSPVQPVDIQQEAAVGWLRDQLGGDPFWSRDQMLAHGFDFRPEWWQQRVCEPAWAAWLSGLPYATRGETYRRITRRDLLTASEDQPGDVERLLVGCYAWGTGDQAFRVPRRALVFVEFSGWLRVH